MQQGSSNDAEISIFATGLFACAGHGLKALVEAADPAIEVVAQHTLSRLAPELEGLQHAVVLVDVDGDIEEVTHGLERIRSAAADLRLGLVSGSLLRGTISSLLQYAPRGFLSKGLDGCEMAASIRLIAAGHLVFGAEVIAHLGHPPPPLAPRLQLEAREKELLTHVMGGLDNTAIATQMFLSRSAVKRDVQTVLAKLGVKNRTQAAVWASRYGITS